MKQYLEQTFKDKKILILGFGREGKSTLGILRDYFPEQNITVADQNNIPEDLGNFTQKQVGEDYLKNLKEFDVIIKSPGVSAYLPEISDALSAGIKITSQTKIFFDCALGKIVGITGTKGKSTTSSLIYEILKAANLNVNLIGNIGSPVLDQLKSDSPEKIYVFELSSHQLFDLDKSPHIAVVTNIGVDHLDWYGTVENYINAKTNILKFQTKQDIAVLNYDNLITREFDRFVKGALYYVSRDTEVEGAYAVGSKIYLNINSKTEFLGDALETQLLGRHNWDNIMQSAVVAGYLGINKETIWKAVKNFKPLEHHLEFVKEINGVKIFNDSFAVDQIAAKAAVDSFNSDITLIMGGFNRGIEYSEIAKFLTQKQNLKNIVLMGQVADELQESLTSAGFKNKIINLKNSNLEEIVAKAFSLATQNSVLLFSPAAASFDMFRDYKDRGEQFKKAVMELK